MKNKIISFFDIFETEKSKKIIKWIVVAALFIYLITSISAYAQWFPGSTKYFAYNTTSGLIIRVVTSTLFLFACLLVFISYKKDINYKWLIVFLVLLFVILLCMLYTPTYYEVLYRTVKLYDFMAQYQTSVSLKTVVEMYFSFAIDILFGYCFVFVLPHAFNKRTTLLFIFIPFLLAMLYSIGWSFIHEKEYYIKFLKGDWQYNAVTIGSIFGNKQQWGIFLAPTVSVAIVSCCFICKSNLKKTFKYIFSILFILISLLALFCTIAAFCKTAILTNIIFIAVSYIGIIFWLFINKKKKVLGFISIGLLVLFITGYLIFMNVDSLHASGFGATLYKIITTFFQQSETGAESRIEIMMGTLQNFPATNIFFGFSKGVLDCFVRTTVPYMNNGLHTGLAIYFGRTGIVGFAIYLILLGFILLSLFKLIKKNILYGSVLFAIFISSFVLNLGELEILVISSSITVLMLNLVVVSLPVAESLN